MVFSDYSPVLDSYFEESAEGFSVWRAFGGVMGIALCNDRRWPETYRAMGLQDVEMIFIGYNTPLHYAPDPIQDPLQAFHNHLVMQAGAYQNGTWVVGVAKGGTVEGVESLAALSSDRTLRPDRGSSRHRRRRAHHRSLRPGLVFAIQGHAGRRIGSSTDRDGPS